MLSSSRSGNVINQAQRMEPNYLTRPEICHGFPKLNSLATSAGTSASATGWEKMLRCQWEGGTHRRPRTQTLSNHSFLALVAWRMNVAKENPHLESSCIERNKSRKSVSTLKFCWTDFSLIECKHLKNEDTSSGVMKIGYNQKPSAIQNREPQCQSWARRKDKIVYRKRTCKNRPMKTDFYKMRLYAVQGVLQAWEELNYENFAPNNAKMTWKNEVEGLHPEQPSIWDF